MSATLLPSCPGLPAAHGQCDKQQSVHCNAQPGCHMCLQRVICSITYCTCSTHQVLCAAAYHMGPG